MQTRAKVEVAMQFLAAQAARGAPLNRARAAAHAETNEINVGRELTKLQASGAWEQLVLIERESAAAAAAAVATTAADSAAASEAAP
eukprot:7120088-Prymnesium_polylepis.1